MDEDQNMKMVRLLIQLPQPLKTRFHALRRTSASELIWYWLTEHFIQASVMGRNGR